LFPLAGESESLVPNIRYPGVLVAGRDEAAAAASALPCAAAATLLPLLPLLAAACI